jgi:hypothetical protein
VKSIGATARFHAAHARLAIADLDVARHAGIIAPPPTRVRIASTA